MELDLGKAREFYRQMLLIRRFEEKCVELYSNQKIRGFLHLYNGEEAIAVGLMNALSLDDAVFSTYREHGHALARGVSATSIMAEMFGKVEGCSRGRGGSMHLFDAKTRFYGGSSIVAGALPLAVGMALADKRMERNCITVCIFSNGTIVDAEFQESLNLATLLKLPILFVCESNSYAMGTALEYSKSETDISKKVATYNIKAKQIDGMSFIDVAKTAKESVEDIKNGNGPIFLECLTYRFRAHSILDDARALAKTEVAKWIDQDPLIRFEKLLKECGQWYDINIQKLEREIDTLIDEAVRFAENGRLEPIEDLERFVYSELSHG